MDDRVPTVNKQKAIDKCIQQLVDHAAQNTVLQAKKIMLQFVCWDYCQMSREVLNKIKKNCMLQLPLGCVCNASHQFTQYHFYLGTNKCSLRESQPDVGIFL